MNRVDPGNLERTWERGAFPFGLVFFVAFVTYYLTAARDLTFAHYGGDGGELIAASYTLGIPHPPGYPLYTLIGKVVSMIPLGRLAFRYSLLSAICMALTAALISRIVSRVGRCRAVDSQSPAISGIVLGLVFAFTPLVWSQALIPEIYSLNLLVIALLLNNTLVDESRKRPVLIGLILGISITTHLTSAMLIPMILLLNQRASWHRVMVGFAAGLLPWLVLPLLAGSGSPVIWGDPSTIKGWSRLVTANIYQENILAKVPEAGDWRIFLDHVGPFFVLCFLAIAIDGRAIASRHRTMTLGLMGTASAYAAYALSYNSDDAVVYLLPGLLLLGPIFGPPLSRIGLPALVLPLALVGLNFARMDVSKDYSVRTNALALFQSVPGESIVITPGDQSISAIWYFKYGEGLWPESIVVDEILFQFEWYRRRLQSRYPKLAGLARDDFDRFTEVNLARFSDLCRLSIVEPISVACQSNQRFASS